MSERSERQERFMAELRGEAGSRPSEDGLRAEAVERRLAVWLDEDKRIRTAHDCVEGRRLVMLPTNHLVDGAGWVRPYFTCDVCNEQFRPNIWYDQEWLSPDKSA